MASGLRCAATLRRGRKRGSANSTRNRASPEYRLVNRGDVPRAVQAQSSGWSTPIACWGAELESRSWCRFSYFSRLRAIPRAMIPRLAGVCSFSGECRGRARLVHGQERAHRRAPGEPVSARGPSLARGPDLHLSLSPRVAHARRRRAASGPTPPALRDERPLRGRGGRSSELVVMGGRYVAGLKARPRLSDVPEDGADSGCRPGCSRRHLGGGTSSRTRSRRSSPIGCWPSQAVLVVVAAWGASLRAGVSRRAPPLGRREPRRRHRPDRARRLHRVAPCADPAGGRPSGRRDSYC